MNEEELLQKIKNAEQQLANARRMLEDYKKSRVIRPRNGDRFYFITQRGTVSSVIWTIDPADEDKFKIGNVFNTQEEAEKAVQQLKTHQKIKEFAYRYNDGEIIDIRERYCIGYYALYNKQLYPYYLGDCVLPNTIYFKDKNFLDALLKEIPESEIIEYCKGN